MDKGKTENTNARIQSNGVPFDKQHIKNKKQFDECDAIYSNNIVFHSSARLMAFNETCRLDQKAGHVPKSEGFAGENQKIAKLWRINRRFWVKVM